MICSRAHVKIFFSLLILSGLAAFVYYFIALETKEVIPVIHDSIPSASKVIIQSNQPIGTVPTTATTVPTIPTVDGNSRRKLFCSKIHPSFRFFQDVCQSSSPVVINYSPKPLANSQLASTPIAIIGTNRSYALYRTLHALTSADGVDPSLITVFLDGIFKEPTLVVQLFNVKVQYNTILPDKIPAAPDQRNRYFKLRIDTHYKLSLDKIFTLNPDAKQVIILEDDLEISPDFFSYFNQTIGLLYEDPSLYCISAWNDFSYQHSSQDPTLLYRVDTMPGLGWIMTRSLYEEVGPKWPTESEPLTWDGWIREPAQRKGRECIIPDVCRTFHFASSGVHIVEQQQKKYFDTHSFNKHTKLFQLQTKNLRKDAYEDMMTNLIKQASLVDHTLSICSESLIPDTKNHTYVIFVEGIYTLLDAMRCFKLWDIDFRPGHKDSYRFWQKSNHVILIRCPESPYCKLKPGGIPLIKHQQPPPPARNRRKG